MNTYTINKKTFKTMNIALIGYGKMGKMIESICKEREIGRAHV